jgi:hypothetical protein
VGPLDPPICKVLMNALVTRFSVLLNVAKKLLPEVIDQWGKLYHLEGRDIIYMHNIISKAQMVEMHLLSVCIS